MDRDIFEQDPDMTDEEIYAYALREREEKTPRYH